MAILKNFAVSFRIRSEVNKKDVDLILNEGCLCLDETGKYVVRSQNRWDLTQVPNIFEDYVLNDIDKQNRPKQSLDKVTESNFLF